MNELKTILLQTAPRILGFIDREKQSPTYGCCDRYFWHYKLHDICNARFQEAALFLTLLYNNNFEGNIYYQKPVLGDWILASITFWFKQIHRGGYLCEVYPFERSTCATAFSTFAALESLLLLSQGNNEIKAQADQILKSPEFQKEISRIGCWINKNYNEDAMNQVAAAALALQNIYLCSKDESQELAANQLIEKIVESYSKNGFYNEYGGFDVGYSTITNSLLSWYSKKPPDNDALIETICACNERIDQELNSDGRYNPSGKSRKTQFLYPYGLKAQGSNAFEKLLNGIQSNSVITPLWLDDRYCIGLATDYLKTFTDFYLTEELKA